MSTTNKQSMVKEAYYFGRELMADSICSNQKIEKTAEVLEKRAAMREAEEAAFHIKCASHFGALENAVAFLEQSGLTKAAELLYKAAMDEAEELAQSLSSEEEDDLVSAAVQGAAEELAEETGQSPEDPEVQAAAEAIISENLAQITDASADEVAQ